MKEISLYIRIAYAGRDEVTNSGSPQADIKKASELEEAIPFKTVEISGG